MRLFKQRRHSHESSSSAQAFSMMKKWFHDCKQNHEKCRSEDQSLPTRIVQIMDSPRSPVLRLLESSSLHDRYVALSYRWLPESPFKLTKSNHAAYLMEIPWSTLPSIFHDAVAVCASLGIQYLWIDSLCILQDSPQDWQIESSRMSDVYRNAELVVGASLPASADEKSQFLGPRQGHFV